MNYIVTAQQMKTAEGNAVKRGVTLLTLAENAARACFDYISRTVDGENGNINGKTFTILCGKGMNGGDGLLLASLLKKAEGETLCVFFNSPNEIGGTAGKIYSKYAPVLNTTVYSEDKADSVKYVLKNSNVIIDCVFGTGFHGDLDAKTADLFSFINTECDCCKFSVDLPSGVNSDTGERDGNAFIPNVTLALGAYKKGLLSHSKCQKRDFCGNCVVMDIGLVSEDYYADSADSADSANSEKIPQFSDSAILLQRPERFKSSHKGDYGRLLNIAGSERYIGAALLSTKAALRAGAGIVVLAAPKNVIQAIASAIPEAVFTYIDPNTSTNSYNAILLDMQSASAISIGCGMGNKEETRKIVEFVIHNASCPIILDADGINSISDNINILQTSKSSVKAEIIMTPHPGEFSRLTGIPVAEIRSNRIDYAVQFAKEFGAIIVLKGVNTVIAAPDGRVTVNPTGNAGLAKAGTGDVLTGIIASLAAQAAQGVKPYEAAVLGVYLHGLAADELAKGCPLHGITAGDVAEKVGRL